jgi:hypothetical protein
VPSIVAAATEAGAAAFSAASLPVVVVVCLQPASASIDAAASAAVIVFRIGHSPDFPHARPDRRIRVLAASSTKPAGGVVRRPS